MGHEEKLIPQDKRLRPIVPVRVTAISQDDGDRERLMIIMFVANNRLKTILFLLTGLVMVIARYGVSMGTQDESSNQSSARIEPAADDLLRKMSDKLANAKQFTVAGERTQDPTLEGDTDKGAIKFDIAAQRPSGLKARAIGDKTARTLFYDGKQATLLDEKENLYASVTTAGTNDEMLDTLHEMYGFAPPLVDFLVHDPYKDLTRNVLSGRELGRETINGVECHHLVFTQDNNDWEIWIADSDQLPRKFVIDGENKQGPPQLTVMFTMWDLAPQLSSESFSFKPSQGAAKIEMIPQANPPKAPATDNAPGRPEPK